MLAVDAPASNVPYVLDLWYNLDGAFAAAAVGGDELVEMGHRGNYNQVQLDYLSLL